MNEFIDFPRKASGYTVASGTLHGFEARIMLIFILFREKKK